MPYQLHCVVPLQLDDATLLVLGAELGAEVDVELLIELVLALVARVDEVLDALEVLVDIALLVFTELLLVTVLLLTAVEQTVPVMVGFSATPPLVSPCTPKLTD